MRRGILLGLTVGLGAAVAGVYMLVADDGTPPAASSAASSALPDGAIVAVEVPELTGPETIGANAFAAKCAACHGENAAGREGMGPPLIHKFYFPGHHGDEAFLRAPEFGVRQHHWPFGDMPPVKGVTRADVLAIVTYIRRLQRENGIY